MSASHRRRAGTPRRRPRPRARSAPRSMPAATGGSPMPRAPTGVSGSAMFDRVPRHVLRRVENRRRLVLVEPLRERHAVLLVVDPLLADARGRCRASIGRAPGRRALRGWMTVPTSATASVVDRRGTCRSRCRLRLPRSRRRRTGSAPSRGYVSLATPISPWPASAVADVFVNALMSSGSFVAVELAAELDRFLRRLRERHAAAGPARRARRRRCTARACRRAPWRRSPAAS